MLDNPSPFETKRVTKGQMKKTSSIRRADNDTPPYHPFRYKHTHTPSLVPAYRSSHVLLFSFARFFSPLFLSVSLPVPSLMLDSSCFAVYDGSRYNWLLAAPSPNLFPLFLPSSSLSFLFSLPAPPRSLSIIIRGHIRPLCPGPDIQHNPP